MFGVVLVTKDNIICVLLSQCIISHFLKNLNATFNVSYHGQVTCAQSQPRIEMVYVAYCTANVQQATSS